MKKMLAIAVAMMMCITCSAAMAQELQQAEVTVDAPAGLATTFKGLGTLIIPEELVQTEVPADSAAIGIFDFYANADASAFIMIGANEMTNENAVEDLIATLQADASYSDIGILTINGIAWLAYTQAESNLQMFSTNVGNALVTFYCSPANDEAYVNTFVQILGSLTPEAAE